MLRGHGARGADRPVGPGGRRRGSRARRARGRRRGRPRERRRVRDARAVRGARPRAAARDDPGEPGRPHRADPSLRAGHGPPGRGPDPERRLDRGVPAGPPHGGVLRDEGLRPVVLGGARRRAARLGRHGHLRRPGRDRHRVRRDRGRDRHAPLPLRDDVVRRGGRVRVRRDEAQGSRSSSRVPEPGPLRLGAVPARSRRRHAWRACSSRTPEGGRKSVHFTADRSAILLVELQNRSVAGPRHL